MKVELTESEIDDIKFALLITGSRSLKDSMTEGYEHAEGSRLIYEKLAALYDKFKEL